MRSEIDTSRHRSSSPGGFSEIPRFDRLSLVCATEGHLVGPHSDAHLLYASWENPPRLLVTRLQFQTDLQANLHALAAHGIPPGDVRLFLPPYEHHTEEIACWTKEAGLTLVNMTPGCRSHTDYMTDRDPHFISAENIVASILTRERTDPDGLNGFLLLMHPGAGPGRTRDHLHDRLVNSPGHAGRPRLSVRARGRLAGSRQGPTAR